MTLSDTTRTLECWKTPFCEIELTISALLMLEFKINPGPKFHHLDKKELIISFEWHNNNFLPGVQLLDSKLLIIFRMR